MAKSKKFFNKRVKSRKRTLINITILIVCILGIVFCFYLTNKFSKSSSSSEGSTTDTNVVLRESINIEINGNVSSDEIFFEELSGVDEKDITVDLSNVDFSKIGTYTVAITISGKTSYVSLNIVDVTSPQLIVNTYVISAGESYSYTDFVTSCLDNSNEECIISFKTGSYDGNDNIINYASYSSVGTYDIVIVATDSSGNQTLSTTTLYVTGDSDDDYESQECTYGSSSYSSAYILAYNVTNNGCALSLDLYQNTTVREAIETIAENEESKIKTEIDSIADLSQNLVIYKSITAILNDTADGFVGYSLYIEISDNDGNRIVSYYLTESGTRIYIENPYNLS